jgi:hypothetical protein
MTKEAVIASASEAIHRAAAQRIDGLLRRFSAKFLCNFVASSSQNDAESSAVSNAQHLLGANSVPAFALPPFLRQFH